MSTFSIDDYEKLKPAVSVPFPAGNLIYHVPNRTALWRVETLLTKEPCTIEWLNGIEPGTVLLDVGANVGMYTVYAARLRGAHVYAFEPESQNYALLNLNLHANRLQGQVLAFCAGLSDEPGLGKLYLSQFSQGGSCHSLGEEVGFDLKPRSSPFVQGAVSCTLDQVVTSGMVPVPEYIKVDVDGFEHKVLRGGRATLADPRVRSLIIELNPELAPHRELVQLLEELGFRYDPAQVQRAARAEGTFKGVGEWIFERRAGAQVAMHGTHAAVPGQTMVHTYVPPVVRSGGADTERLLDHVLERIRATPIQSDPFPHAVIDDVFPVDYYDAIDRHFPDDAQMVPLSETGRATGYKERLVTLFEEDAFARLDATQRQFWGELGAWLYGPRFINGVIGHYHGHVSRRIDDLARRHGQVRVRGDALIVSDKNHYAIGPHTDAAHRLITFLFYLPRDERFASYGTSLYRPKDPQFRCAGGPHYPFDRFNRVQTLEFVPNRLLIFVRTDQSFHGVEPIDDQALERRLLINNIRLIA